MVKLSSAAQTLSSAAQKSSAAPPRYKPKNILTKKKQVILPRPDAYRPDAYETLTTSTIDRNSVLRKLNEFINVYNSGADTDKRPLKAVVTAINNYIRNSNYISYEKQKRKRDNIIFEGFYDPNIIEKNNNNKNNNHKYRIVLKNEDDQSASQGITPIIQYNNTLQNYIITFNENSNTGNIDKISITPPIPLYNAGSRGGKSKVKRNKTKKHSKITPKKNPPEKTI